MPDPRFRKAIVSLYFGTVTIISDIYVAQPILPLLRDVFSVSPPVASLAVSLTILGLSFALLFWGPVSDYRGRKPVMTATAFLLVIPTFSIAAVDHFSLFLIFRFLQGICVAGIAAIAMAYIVEEFPPSLVGKFMGIYFSSMVAAGLFGRMASGIISGMFGWRIMFVIFGFLNCIGAVALWRFLPASHRFAGKAGFRDAWRGMFLHFRNRRLAGAFVIAFTLFFAFTGVFTYVTFHLSGPPYELSTVSLGFIFTVYIAGIISPAAGVISGRIGRGTVIATGLSLALAGVWITIIPSVTAIIIGLFILCAGLFTVQPAASAFVGDNANESRGAATSLYLFSYYIGGSAGAVMPGLLWGAFGWTGVVVFCSMMIIVSFLSLATLCR